MNLCALRGYPSMLHHAPCAPCSSGSVRRSVEAASTIPKPLNVIMMNVMMNAMKDAMMNMIYPCAFIYIYIYTYI